MRLVDDDNENDDYDDVDDEKVDDIISGVLEESIVNNDPGDIVSGIDDLKKAGIIDSTLSSHLTTLQRAAFKRIPGTSLPTYDICVEPKKKNTKPKFSPFVEISRSGKSVFIHKTISVWLGRRKGLCRQVIPSAVQLHPSFFLWKLNNVLVDLVLNHLFVQLLT